MADIETVTIHVDPACPWCWLTSRWLAEVETVRPVRVRTRLFSLREINREHEADDRIRQAHEAAEAAERVLVQARRAGGDDALARLYAAIGEAHHEQAEPLGDRETLRRAATAAGLDPGIVDTALADPSTLDELLEEHRAVAARGAFGVPALILGEAPPMFGPVVDRRITGEDAGQLWDRVSWLLGQEHFFELKRDRTGRPDIGRYREELEGRTTASQRERTAG